MKRKGATGWGRGREDALAAPGGDWSGCPRECRSSRVIPAAGQWHPGWDRREAAGGDGGDGAIRYSNSGGWRPAL